MAWGVIALLLACVAGITGIAPAEFAAPDD